MSFFTPVRGNILPASPSSPINWQKCFLCQSEKDENLRDPARNNRGTVDEGYHSLAEKLLQFAKLGKVPFNLDVKTLDEGPGLVSQLIKNRAVYHHSCFAYCSSSRLKREQEKKKKRSLSFSEENKENAFTPSPVKNPRCGIALAHDRALQHLLQFMNDSRASLTDTAPVFYVTDLAKKYEEKMKEMGHDYDVHTTRLKDRLLSASPILEATGSQGKVLMITFKNDVDSAIRRLSSNEYQSAEIDPSVGVAGGVVRQDLLKQEKYDWHDISKEAQYSCTPKSLRMLLKILLNGPTPESDVDVFDPIVNSLSQIIRYHAVKRKRASERGRRHDQSKECPMPVYFGLKLYADTREKKLVEIAHKTGFSISYDRVQDIITDIANRNASLYQSQGVVCPPSMQKNVFTTAAADNFDHNTSSATASDSFHGTAISLLQHPTSAQGDPSWQPLPTVSTGKKVQSLPKDFADVQPCYLNPKDAKFASTLRGKVAVPCLESPYDQECEWLESVASGGEEAVNWSTHHAAQERRRGQVRVITPSALLPLFKQHAATIPMMLHAMKVAKAATDFLNPGQTTVLTVDQPLYAICRSLQLLQPADDFNVGEEKLMVMMGGLHIEMCFLRCLGQWAEGSGWTRLLTEAKILTEGRAESVLKGSHVTRTRYAHEVTAAVLYLLLKEAYDDDGDFVPFDSWREDKRNSVPQFSYWHTFLVLQLTMLQFVRSLRSADFDCYVETLNLIMPWFFALDHSHYARWCSVHVRDMVNIDQTHPALASEFRAGRFVGRNSCREFSGMALDQVHEQLNARLKGNSGVVGLTEAPDTLLKWLLSGPDVAAVLEKLEEVYGMQETSNFTLHHNDTAAANSAFRRDVKALKDKFLDRGNPFLESGEELYNIDTGRVVDAGAVKAIMDIENIGKRQYVLFVEERLESATKKLDDPIAKNNFLLMKATTKKKVVTKVASLKSDVSLFSKLWMATHLRKGDMNEFFKHENQALPPSLTSNGSMRLGEKSEIVPCLTSLTPHSLMPCRPTVDAVVLDGAALVNMISPTATCKTFEEYFDSFKNYVVKEMTCVSRVDLVFDVYKKDSLKNGARSKRGEGQRMRVTLNSKLPTSWPKFLRDSQNKEDLFTMLADYLVAKDYSDKVLLVTRQTSCLSSTGEVPGNLSPCNHEEADTRMMLHAASASGNGCPRVLIRTVDSDVVVLAVWTANQMAMAELWVSYGVGKYHKYIAAHEIAKTLGPQKCEVLPALHIFSGCDITSSFTGIGKKKAFEAWMSFPDANEGLKELTEGRLEEALPLLEKLVIAMYCKKSKETKVDSCRRELFQRGRQITNIPPTQDALMQHLKRVKREVQVATNSLTALPIVPSPAECGWRRAADGNWEAIWITRPEASKALKQLVSCKCKAACKQSSCSCLKMTKWNCSDLCGCACPKSSLFQDTSDDE